MYCVSTYKKTTYCVISYICALKIMRINVINGYFFFILHALNKLGMQKYLGFNVAVHA